MAMYEQQKQVNVEFLKSSQGFMKGRVIKLSHGHQLPPQLIGRVDPPMWQAFMTECSQLAETHPYTESPKAGQYGQWLLCGLMGAVVGFCAVNPDSGDYGAWLTSVHAMLGRWQQSFQQADCALSLQSTRLIWIQIDIHPRQARYAEGYPVKY